MTRQVRVLGAARQDLRDLFAWYDDQEQSLGAALLDCVEERFDFIVAFPFAAQEARLGVRRVTIRQFPVAVYYTVHSETIDVIAILHTRRSPTAWKSRIE